MRVKSRFLSGILAIGMLTGCSNDEILVNDGSDNPVVNNGEKVYMAVNVKLPTAGGTRSETEGGGQSTGGNEVGKDYENNVSTMLIVLADKDNKIVTYSTVDNLNTDDAGVVDKGDGSLEIKNATVTATASFKKTAIATYYTGDHMDAGTGQLKSEYADVHVFTFCNYTEDLRKAVEKSSGATTDAEATAWTDAVCTVNETKTGVAGVNPWAKNAVLMSNKSLETKAIPSRLDDWNAYAFVTSPFNLSGSNANINNGGAISVERSVARFDFKDGSPAATPANTYYVGKETDATLMMELTKMALVNMSKKFYYLRRVSDDGLPGGAGFGICGNEHSENYVVDVFAQDKYDHKVGDNTAGNKFSNYFNFCLGYGESHADWTINEYARNQWFTSEISEVLGNEDDNDDTWNKPDSKGDYKIWRYVTENTVPVAPNGQIRQNNGITTGVVFKGKFMAIDGKTPALLKGAIEKAAGYNSETELKNGDTPVLYVFDNTIYVGWKGAADEKDPQDVIASASAAAEGTALFRAVFGEGAKKDETTGEVTPVAGSLADIYDKNGGFNDDFCAAATKVGFTMYEASYDEEDGGGYYCYYYYWNRHNNNDDPTVMGPMEFAVVRNNVYKLAVTEIGKLGHPRVSKNDPDPVDPDTPDEKGDLYIRVSVEVLPWVVRVNDIVFN